ncbi:hypothetical protein B0E53_01559 [Micromonospora sp. MH33]|nr:hypothetical protein B0E53_01559 [Micromonospora sp. MH33]
MARQYSGTWAKTGNCQIGVSVQAVTDTASVAANWRLFCPRSWDDTMVTDPDRAAAVRARRDRARMPDDVRHREKWRLALDMLDEMIDRWGLPKLPVAADSGYGDCTLFRLGLAERGLRYVVQVDPTATAHPADAVPVTPAYSGRGRPPRPAYPDPPATLKDLVLATGRETARQTTSRRGSRRSKTNPTGAMRSHFLRLRIRPANRDIPRDDDGSLPECWLIAEWPPNTDEPVKVLAVQHAATHITQDTGPKIRWPRASGRASGTSPTDDNARHVVRPFGTKRSSVRVRPPRPEVRGRIRFIGCGLSAFHRSPPECGAAHGAPRGRNRKPPATGDWSARLARLMACRPRSDPA